MYTIGAANRVFGIVARGVALSGVFSEHVGLSTTETAVPTFNSCTKCVVSPGKIHERTPD